MTGYEGDVTDCLFYKIKVSVKCGQLQSRAREFGEQVAMHKLQLAMLK